MFCQLSSRIEGKKNNFNFEEKRLYTLLSIYYYKYNAANFCIVTHQVLITYLLTFFYT